MLAFERAPFLISIWRRPNIAKTKANIVKTRGKREGGILDVDNSLFCAKNVEFYKKKLRFDCGLFLAICMHIV